MAPEFAVKVADLKCDKLIIQWSICNLRLPNIDFEKLGAVITIQSAGIPKKNHFQYLWDTNFCCKLSCNIFVIARAIKTVTTQNAECNDL